MSLYTRSREEWNKAHTGDGYTVQAMFVAITDAKSEDMTVAERSAISSFMSTISRCGYARKDDSTRPARYYKVSDAPTKSGPKRKTPPKDDLDEVQVGNAILAVIEKLTEKNKELKDIIKLLNTELADAVKGKQEVEEMLRKSQERILELNQTSGKGRKTVNLHELQSLTRQ